MKMATRETSELVFFVNGLKVVEKNPNPDETLLTYLRKKLHLTGVKQSCGQGACGSCTVMVSRLDRSTYKVCHSAVTACLVPVCSLHGLAVTTIEGIGSVSTRLHPVQEQLVLFHGTQCGYCTPGFAMSMYTLLRNNPKPSMNQVLKALKGNLCRCTGYRPILDGFKQFTKDYCPMGDKCCQRTAPDTDSSQEMLPDKLVYDASQEPIFPPELQLSSVLDEQIISFHHGAVTWHRPTSLAYLLHLKAMYPGAKIVAGNTTLGLEKTHQSKHYPVLVSISQVPDLHRIVTMDTGIKFGAGVTLTAIEEYIQETLQGETASIYRSLVVLGEVLDTFAALQIKNMVTIGGCVSSCWSNSDVIPFLCAIQASIHVASQGQPERMIPIVPELFKSPGVSTLKDKDVIVSVWIPFLKQDQYVYSLKQSHRDFDTAITSTSVVFTVNDQGTIKEGKMYFGNILPTVYFAQKLSDGLSGKLCDPSVTVHALSLLQEELKSLPSLDQTPDKKTLLEVSTWTVMMRLVTDQRGPQAIPSDLLSAVIPLEGGYERSTQVYEEVPDDQPDSDAVGRPLPHRAARQQATGEAQYIDDMPTYDNELFLSLVVSPHSHANIVSIDPSEALKVPGVVDVLTHTDVPGHNTYGGRQDELVFAQDKVTCVGQVVAAVLATNKTTADMATKLVHVEYDPLPGIYTIKEAIDAESYFANSRCFSYGDCDAGFKASDQIVEGEIELGGQEHFYLETQRCLVVPLKEEQQITVYAGSQFLLVSQMAIARVLGISCNSVSVVTKRIGGAFGGKQTRIMATVATAVAAFKHKKPVRCLLDRDLDMQMTGGRHPMYAKYKVGVSSSGLIQAVDLEYYANAGNTVDSSLVLLEKVVVHFDNCYKIPNASLRSYCCKTNMPSNTAMRGFGTPQAILITETLISHTAEKLGLPLTEFRERNLYKLDDKLPLGGSTESMTIERCWKQVLDKSNYNQRLTEIEDYNSKNRYRKRGIHVGPLKFGLPIPAAFMNKAAALVNIYLDGSVLVHHGGVEFGQGLHTKMLQIASRVLGLPIDNIRVQGSMTDIIPNPTITGASANCDLSGAAVLDGCQQLMDRLQPYKDAKPDGSWTDWVNAAYMDRVSLSASGFYKEPTKDLGYNFETDKGVKFAYYTWGAACTEVELDILTGKHVVCRTDIVMDVGRSLNPAIDIGQIEGAFVMGYGFYCLEDLKFDAKGHLLTKNAMGYKIPVASNVPKEFNVSLLKGSSNPRAVYSSKGIGEPALLLAHTVAMAIREAIKSYRQSIGMTDHIQLNTPATADRVRQLCPVTYTQ